MKATRIIMGMPITIEIVDASATSNSLEKVFKYFEHVDEKFSTYKDTSEIMAINRDELKESEWSDEMKEVFKLSEGLKQKTNGYFDIRKPDGSYDPSGLVKGWSIRNAAQLLEKDGFKNFYVDAGGDIEVLGRNAEGKMWSVGIRNPFNRDQIVKVVYLDGERTRGMATSGTYIRGQHIYNPHRAGPLEDIVSLTVLGPDVFEADKITTPAFAMGREGIYFIEKEPSLEGYMIDKDGIGTETTGFEKYTHNA